MDAACLKSWGARGRAGGHAGAAEEAVGAGRAGGRESARGLAACPERAASGCLHVPLTAAHSDRPLAGGGAPPAVGSGVQVSLTGVVGEGGDEEEEEEECDYSLSDESIEESEDNDEGHEAK